VPELFEDLSTTRSLHDLFQAERGRDRWIDYIIIIHF
jgi:hypothetical protein